MFFSTSTIFGAVQALAQGLAVGTFETQEIRPPETAWTDSSKRVVFPKPFDRTPGLAVGFTSLNVDKSTTVRITAYADNISLTQAYVHIDTWGGTRVYSASSVWCGIALNDTNFQTGQFSTLDDHAWDHPQQNTSRAISFGRPFSAPPKHHETGKSLITADQVRQDPVSPTRTHFAGR
ncbi:hypothetical protein AURDEDRAFT_177026 [Auricularia subglabra TFB-10046 SS5]|uniref:H-type lectin domain-containing protein n=1 Tax=Auricularia subglabra (strain TFB-10046 / SS5) TaxID=717982 RepID=J0CU88_AURST|nr:hypothetical protein AURDEDRAFT_177026 [Auricularia subglabra TFB-10046 SS5]